MEKKDYYGSEEQTSLSYLEFGSIDLNERTKKIWAYWQDQEAYDLYMFSRYSRDLISFRDFLEQDTISIEALNDRINKSAHDKILDYLFKYAGMISVEDNTIICESGSSLYGWIDEAYSIDAVFHNGSNTKKINSLSYLASDISEIMNKGAQLFHPGVNIMVSTAPTISDLARDISERLCLHLSLFYGLSVSLRYALRKTEDILKICNVSDLFLSNRLSLSFADTFTQIYGTGKMEYIVSLPELISLLKRYNYKAKYCTAGMQYEKDGKGSVRVSVAISKDEEIIDKFIKEYNYCVELASKTVPVEQGEWLDLWDLKEDL